MLHFPEKPWAFISIDLITVIPHSGANTAPLATPAPLSENTFHENAGETSRDTETAAVVFLTSETPNHDTPVIC